MWVVYRHRNITNGKSYIGITSQDPVQRWGKNGIKYKANPKFWPAIEKYGWDNFEHIIVFTNLTKTEACQKEKELIQYYDTYNNGYNASLGGESGSNGCNKQDINRKKISKGMKTYLKNNPNEREKRIKQLLDKDVRQKRADAVNKHFSAGSQAAKDRVKKNKKSVRCVETGQIFEGIAEAAKWCHIDSSGISKCLKGTQKTAGKHPHTKEPLHWELYLF